MSALSASMFHVCFSMPHVSSAHGLCSSDPFREIPRLFHAQYALDSEMTVWYLQIWIVLGSITLFVIQLCMCTKRLQAFLVKNNCMFHRHFYKYIQRISA